VREAVVLSPAPAVGLDVGVEARDRVEGELVELPGVGAAEPAVVRHDGVARTDVGEADASLEGQVRAAPEAGPLDERRDERAAFGVAAERGARRSVRLFTARGEGEDSRR